MRKSMLLFIVGLTFTVGCQMHGNQPYGNPYSQGYGSQPGYDQTFPPPAQAPPQGQLGRKAGRFLGDMAGGFVRSAVGGAGFTAGRDLWNSIVR